MTIAVDRHLIYQFLPAGMIVFASPSLFAILSVDCIETQ